MKVRILLIILILLPFSKMLAQPADSVQVDAFKYPESDSMIYLRIEQINVTPRRARNMNYRRYSRLVSKIRKVYPFAKAASAELAEYNEKFENATSERERRKYVRLVEKKLFADHEETLKRFTISEGRYLILLIDRETGNNSYSIIKEVKGGISAVFWQGIAKIFRNDLKERYDPTFKHYVIEQIVLNLEREEKINKAKLPKHNIVP